jgi:hypothetical protein
MLALSIAAWLGFVGVGLLIGKVLGDLGVVFRNPYPTGHLILKAFALLCVVFVYHPIRRRMAMYAYLSWLKSFEEEWEEPQTRRGRIWRLVDIFGRFGRKATRRVKQINIRLALRGRGNTATELQGPGEIFLE